MKQIRIYSSLVLAAAAMLCLSSCKKENEGESVTLKVQFEQNAAQKIYLSDGNTVNYFQGETIQINNALYPVVNAAVQKVSAASNYVAVYPASNTGFTSAGGSVSIPSVQTYSEINGRQNVEAPMVAYLSTSTGTLMFRNTASLLRVRVVNPSNTQTFNIESILVDVASDWISGTQNITFSGSTTNNPIAITSITGANKQPYVKLEFTNETLAAGAYKDYYLITAPFSNQTLHTTVIGTVNGDVKKRYTKSSPVTLALPRSTVGNVQMMLDAIDVHAEPVASME